MIHNSESLIKFSQRLLEYVPEMDTGITETEALKLLRSDPDEVYALYDRFVLLFEMYIEQERRTNEKANYRNRSRRVS